MQTVVDTVLGIGIAVAAALVISGAITWFRPALHRALEAIVSFAWLITATILLVGVIAIIVAPRQGNLVTTLGYLIVLVPILFLLGISRLGAPPAPGERRDPNAPILSPAQMAKVDALAAILVGVVYAVLVWRLTDVLALA